MAQQSIDIFEKNNEKHDQPLKEKGTDSNVGKKIRFSLKQNIVDNDGNSYGPGVLLDSTVLDGLSDTERKEMVKLFVVSELAGKSFPAYDSSGNTIQINIAEKSENFRNASGNTRGVLKELYHKNNNNIIKQEAVLLSDELIATSRFDRSEASRYSHDFLDNYGNNDWEKRKTIIQDKNNTVWEATLNIANASDGRKLLMILIQ